MDDLTETFLVSKVRNHPFPGFGTWFTKARSVFDDLIQKLVPTGFHAFLAVNDGAGVEIDVFLKSLCGF